MSWLLLTLNAMAHVGAPIDAIDAQAVAGPDGRLLEASIGLFWTDDGEDWRWICHEAVTTADAVITPRYAAAGRRWLVNIPRLEQARTLEDAVYWTDDGCSWSAATGLTGHEVPEVAIDEVGAVALAVTADEDAESNHIYRSTDGGQSFTAVKTVPAQRLTSVVMAPSALGTAMVGGVDTAGNGWLHWSSDRGETWDSHEVVEGEVLAMALHPTDAKLGYAVIDGVGVETLLRTDDSGRTVSTLLSPDGALTDVEVEPTGGVWVSFAGNAYLYAEDGLEYELVTDAPPGAGVGLADGLVMLATRFELVNEALVEGTRDGGFTPRFTFLSVDGPLTCPTGSEGADICDPLYPVLIESLGEPLDTGGLPDGGDGGDDGEGGAGASADDTAAPSPTADKDGTCGCRQGAWVLLLPLGLLFRRPRHD